MKFFKIILFLALIGSGMHAFSQNKRNNSHPTTLNLPPEPHFSWVNSCAGDTTCFINQSIRAYSYTWTISADTSVGLFGTVKAHIIYQAFNDSILCYHFANPGTYSVTLTCYDNHLDSIIVPITIDTVTQAGFSFIHCTNNFENNSLCASSYYWDFGDGTHSTLSTPYHPYADTGYYKVTLVAYNGSKADTLTQQIYVDVTSFVNASFTSTLSHDTLFVHANYAGEPTAAFNWGFSDGNFRSGRDTFNVYKDSTASYDVELVAINSCGPAFNDDTVKVTYLGLPPNPDFYYVNTCYGDTTCFINQTKGGAGTYTWTVSSAGASPQILFTSADSNACFRFPATGTYSITLLALAHTYLEKSTQIITIGTIPVANFSFTPCSNNFLNNSSCAVSFYWDFGDGTYSTAIVPAHLYADTGQYAVTLIAYNGIDTDTLTQQIHIAVTSEPTAIFTATVTQNNVLTVHGNYTGVPAAYAWSFGDGHTATGKDTVHVYKDSTAAYIVKLVVSNSCGTNATIDTVRISMPVAMPPANLDFTNSVLAIAPNPVPSSGYIDAFYNSYNSNDYLVQIYNILGQEMFEEYFAFESGINEFKISAANFSTGVYIMVLQSGNSYIRKKFYVISTP